MTPRAGTSRTATTERRTSGRSGADHRESRAVRYRRRMTSRTRIEVTGVVQGVGFRPFVHRLATAAGLSGFVCEDCRRELFDPADRRFRYPFINCTNCGPRFTITLSTPYDRPATTMAGFTMCERCRAEYDDPMDRRFHAQPNACPTCGPHLWIEADAGHIADPVAADPVAAARALVARGS